MSKKKRQPQGFKVKPSQPEADTSALVTAEVAVSQSDDATADLALSDNPAVDQYDIPPWEHSLVDVEPLPVSERELTSLMRDWRRGRATKTIRQVLADGYVAVFAAVLVIAMLGGGIYQAQAAAAHCDSNACTVGRTLLPWMAMSAAFCFTALAARVFGPVVASAAEGFWLMAAPIRRGRLLWRRMVGMILAVLAIAAAFGALLAALTGYAGADIARWAVAVGCGAAGLTALAAMEQTWSRSWLITVVQWLLGVAAVGVIYIIIAVSAGWLSLDTPMIPSASAVMWVAVAGGVLLLACGAVALSRLGLIHRARLVSGGSLVSGMQGAAFALDFGLMRDILVERDSARRGQVRPMRGRGKGLNALVWREAQRLWRYPKRILLVVISAFVPYAVAALGFHAFNPFISSLVLLVGFVPMLGSMRIMTRTKGLARTLPMSNPQIRRAMATVPAIFALLWAIACTPAFWGMSAPHYTSLTQAFLTSLLTAVAGLLAAIRWVSAKSANYSIPMMQTGFGALPPGLILNLIRGFDVAILITGPLLLGWPWWVSGIIAVIVAAVLSGFYSMEEMQAMQEQVNKDKAASGGGGGLGGLLSGAKPAAPATKQKIAPPRGYSGPRTIK
ncbi:MAG: DUF6297 family protein [Propionibacteriaceae bacterium]|jgi:hypothetical protein|nr:DUF6297 family protein [Propionibacteriaceae bacterium]